MLYEEFLKETGKDTSDSMKYAYDVINKLYMNDELRTKADAYKYYKRNKYDFDWVDELSIGPHQYIQKPKNLNGIISEDEAKEIINKEFCFEKDKIEICATPYFEAYDFNLIVFNVNNYPRVYSDGDLYDIYR